MLDDRKGSGSPRRINQHGNRVGDEAKNKICDPNHGLRLSPYGDYPVPGEEGISGALESRPHLFRVPTVADQESQLYACL